MLELQHYIFGLKPQSPSECLLLFISKSTQVQIWERASWGDGVWAPTFNEAKEGTLATPTTKWWLPRSLTLRGRAGSGTDNSSFRSEHIVWYCVANTLLERLRSSMCNHCMGLVNRCRLTTGWGVVVYLVSQHLPIMSFMHAADSMLFIPRCQAVAKVCSTYCHSAGGLGSSYICTCGTSHS